jgi:hypothetical protein
VKHLDRVLNNVLVDKICHQGIVRGAALLGVAYAHGIRAGSVFSSRHLFLPSVCITIVLAAYGLLNHCSEVGLHMIESLHPLWRNISGT